MQNLTSCQSKLLVRTHPAPLDRQPTCTCVSHTRVRRIASPKCYFATCYFPHYFEFPGPRLQSWAPILVPPHLHVSPAHDGVRRSLSTDSVKHTYVIAGGRYLHCLPQTSCECCSSLTTYKTTNEMTKSSLLSIAHLSVHLIIVATTVVAQTTLKPPGNWTYFA